MKHFKPNKITPFRFIYITKETETKLNETSRKYHVSLSTITAVCYLKICKHFTQEQREKLGTYFIDKGRRTRVKPKIEYNCLQTTEEMTRLLSNVLYIYANNKILITYIQKEQRQKALQEINTELQQIRETYWNLNEQIRSNRRALSILSTRKE